MSRNRSETEVPIAAPADDPTSTVIQLLYAGAPQISLAGLLGHLCETLGTALGHTVRLTRLAKACADLDLGSHRLTVALHRHGGGLGPGPVQTCLTLAIGSPASAPTSAAAALAGQTSLARKLCAAVTCRLPADQILWHVAPQPLSLDLIAGLHSRLPQSPTRHGKSDEVDLSKVMELVQANLSGTTPRRPRPTIHASHRQALCPTGLWPTLRLTGATPLRGAAPETGPHLNLASPANDTPALPRSDLSGRLRTRSTLHRPQGRPATRLILSVGTTARIEASLLHGI